MFSKRGRGHREMNENEKGRPSDEVGKSEGVYSQKPEVSAAAGGRRSHFQIAGFEPFELTSKGTVTSHKLIILTN